MFSPSCIVFVFVIINITDFRRCLKDNDDYVKVRWAFICVLSFEQGRVVTQTCSFMS